MVQVPCELYLEFTESMKSTEMLIFCREKKKIAKKKHRMSGARKQTG